MKRVVAATVGVAHVAARSRSLGPGLRLGRGLSRGARFLYSARRGRVPYVAVLARSVATLALGGELNPAHLG